MRPAEHATNIIFQPDFGRQTERKGLDKCQLLSQTRSKFTPTRTLTQTHPHRHTPVLPARELSALGLRLLYRLLDSSPPRCGSERGSSRGAEALEVLDSLLRADGRAMASTDLLLRGAGTFGKS